MLFDLLAIAAELLFWHRLLVAMFDTAAWYWSGLWGVFSALDAALSAAWDFSAAPKERCPMETISYTLPPEQDGATVRHILKAALHVSSHAISRLTRTENGIRVNGIPCPYSGYPSHRRRAGGGDQRPPSAPGAPHAGAWPLPIVWEDGHLLVVNKPAGMTAHASNFLPDTPTVAERWPINGGRTSSSMW